MINMSFPTEILLGGICLLVLVYRYLTSTYGYWKEKGIPYAKPQLFFGSFKENLLGRLSIIDIHNNIYKQFEGERYAGYFIMRRPVLMIRDPELIERILVKDFAHFYDRGIPDDPEFEPLTLNLFNTKGQHWRHLRYKLTPTFSSGKLKSMFEQISKCGDGLVEELRQYSQSGEVVEAKSILSIFTTDVIASCAFGLQLKARSPEGITFRQMMSKVFAPSRAQTLRFSLRQMYPDLSKFLGITTFPKEVNEYFLNITKSTIQMREQEKITRDDFVQLLVNLKQQEQSTTTLNSKIEVNEDDALINQLDFSPMDLQKINESKLFTDNCIAAQTFVFMTAGSESTSATLAYVMYCLAKQPEVQQRVQAEIDQVLSAHGGWSYNAVKDMVYLDQVLQEGMRMYPIATFLSRDCTETYPLPGTDIVLEKGQRVSIPVPAIQRDPNNYPNPDLFDPERFRGNNHRPSATYLPFGNGPRICIAVRFAVLEMKVCLARVFAHYSVSLDAKTQEPLRFVPGSFTAQALGGIWVKFHERPSSTQ